MCPRALAQLLRLEPGPLQRLTLQNERSTNDVGVGTAISGADDNLTNTESAFNIRRAVGVLSNWLSFFILSKLRGRNKRCRDDKHFAASARVVVVAAPLNRGNGRFEAKHLSV